MSVLVIFAVVGVVGVVAYLYVKKNGAPTQNS